MNFRQWIAVALIAVAAGGLGGLITGVLGGGINVYVYTPNNTTGTAPAAGPLTPLGSPQADESR